MCVGLTFSFVRSWSFHFFFFLLFYFFSGFSSKDILNWEYFAAGIKSERSFLHAVSLKKSTVLKKSLVSYSYYLLCFTFAFLIHEVSSYKKYIFSYTLIERTISILEEQKRCSIKICLWAIPKVPTAQWFHFLRLFSSDITDIMCVCVGGHCHEVLTQNNFASVLINFFQNLWHSAWSFL